MTKIIKMTPEQRLANLKRKQLEKEELAKKAKQAIKELEKSIQIKRVKQKRAEEGVHEKRIIRIFKEYSALSLGSEEITACLEKLGFHSVSAKLSKDGAAKIPHLSLDESFP